MSHFTVLVVAKDEEELHQRLLPYKEYGLGSNDKGLEPYLEWIETGDPDQRAYYGNPNAKWDWYVVGSRWRGLLELKDGTEAKEAQAGQVDWAAMRQRMRDQFVASIQVKALYDAFVTEDGRWVGDGEMEWWSIQHTKDDDFDVAFWSFVEDLSPDKRIFVVECHT